MAGEEEREKRREEDFLCISRSILARNHGTLGNRGGGAGAGKAGGRDGQSRERSPLSGAGSAPPARAAASPAEGKRGRRGWMTPALEEAGVGFAFRMRVAKEAKRSSLEGRAAGVAAGPGRTPAALPGLERTFQCSLVV